MTKVFMSGAPEGEEVITLSGSEEVAFLEGILQPIEPEIHIIPAVTLWERMTDEEAEQVNTAMTLQPFRTRQIFLTANTFRSDHELWPLLEQVATGLFGEERASEILRAES